MPNILGPEETDLVLKFGGGVHSRAPADEIQDRECVTGQNFDIDLQDTQLRPRLPYDKIGTCPNQEEIRGMASLLLPNGNTSMLIQAGSTVYEWNGSNFTSVGTVNANSRLRGHIWHNWQLDPAVVLITDIELADVVMQWDGTTLSDVAFTDEDDVSYSPFKAKYCIIQNERAIFANVVDKVATDLPHMMVGSKVSDYENITVSNKPSSALGDDDPFYILTPDLRYINSFLYAFEVVIASTQQGQIFKMVGSSAKDFAIQSLYPSSGVAGDEAMRYVGNDVYYGRQGRIESLASNDKFGNVETDDLSRDIFDKIEDYNEWVITYNERTQRVYCYPPNNAEIWTIYKPLVNSGISPWSRYRTSHSMNFNPSTIMNAYDPQDGLEYVFMGDLNGNLYRMEGTPSGGDGGLNKVGTERLSKMITIPKDAEAFNIEGWIRYRKITPVTVTLSFEFQGDHIYTHYIHVDLEGASGGAFYGGAYYYGGESYYGTDTRKFKREKMGIPGKSGEFQIRVAANTKDDFAISEIGLRFTVAS